MGGIDRAAKRGILGLVLAAGLSLVSGVVGAQVILAPDRVQSGATTPETVNAQIKDMATTQQARGTTGARVGVYTVAWPKDAAERDDLADYTVLMVTVLTQTQPELPLQRVYLVPPDGNQTPLRQLSTWFSKVNSKTLAYTQLGKFRQDAFYTIPAAAAHRPGEVRLDFAINRVGFVLIHLPTIEQDLGYELRDPAPGAQPNSAALRTMIQRQFPGFPVPQL
jgi:hypothetical protein